ncbi:hypothetical protein TRIUR3_32772 [Triticum urartu]|uniref:Uncharacterized protein n=1 Tax=Triticum urartu TaxID=4572 RepID=M7YHA2_TRIUA|nr:hypothetical protein TRIUR3_32772 [Triticum urartu]
MAACSPSTSTPFPNKLGLRCFTFLVRLSNLAPMLAAASRTQQSTPNRSPPINETSGTSRRGDRLDVVAGVILLPLNAACLVGKHAVPVAELQPLSEEEGVPLMLDVVRLLGTPWGKGAVRRRGPCRGAPSEIRRDNFSSGSFSLTFFLWFPPFSIVDQQGHNYVIHSQPAIQNYWYMQFTVHA